MGFVNYTGEKEDRYEDIVEFAKFNEELQSQKYKESLRRATDAQYFGVQNLRNLSTDEILKKIAVMFRHLSEVHNQLISNSKTDYVDNQQFEDLWLYTVSELLAPSTLNCEKKNKVSELIIYRVFGLKIETTIAEHYIKINRNKDYVRYLKNCFGIDRNNEDFYWRWLGAVDSVDAYRILDEFDLLFRMLAYYLNQVMPNQGIAIKIMETWNHRIIHLNKMIALGGSVESLQQLMINPLYDNHNEKQETNEYNKYVKCSRIIVGGNMNLDANILTAALYKQYEQGKIEDEKIISILSSKCREIFNNGGLPVIDGSKIDLRSNEKLHYEEHGIIYRALDKDGRNFQSIHGSLFITSERILFNSVNIKKETNLTDVKRIMLFDSCPCILEIQTNNESFLLKTANTIETYEFLKIINNGFQGVGESLRNMENISAEDYKQDSIGAYLFSLRELRDANIPEAMRKSIEDVCEAVSSLDNALQQYPSESEQSYKFNEYFIPEAINLINSYIEYNKAKVDEKTIAPVYNKIMNMLQDVIVAINERVNDIYKIATMRTIAGAETVERILGQDGLIK